MSQKVSKKGYPNKDPLYLVIGKSKGVVKGTINDELVNPYH